MSRSSAFDRSLLPDALAEIAILADTHHTRPDDPSTVEFASRKKQAARARHALDLAASLGTDDMVHLGDLIQDYPDGSDFAQSFAKVGKELRQRHPGLKLVAGNHDVGDKPDVRMPTHPTTASGLQVFHRIWGRSWYRFRVGEVAAYVLNTQIMNTTLAANRRQRAWFEKSLGQEKQKRLLLFIHLPLYLSAPDEPDIGHYDNLGEPDRTWLMRLIRRYRFESVFAGHVHYRFFDRIGRTRYATLGSPSFTRPGFGHLFASAAPPERGRDDRAKLGFALLRIHRRGSSLHWIRTEAREPTDPPPEGRRVLTPVSGERARSPLGFTLCHALSSRHEIPLVWPATIRQPIRNDQPLLALAELGTGWIRTSWRDFLDPFQEERLRILKDEGVALVALVDLPEISAFLKNRERILPVVSGIELRLATGETIEPSVARRLGCIGARRRKLTLSPILPGMTVPGKQHPRTRTAWQFDELAPVRAMVTRAGLAVDRWRILAPPDPLPIDGADGVDLAVEFTDNDRANILEASWGLAQVAAGRGRRLSVYPVRDLDRTMDLHHGILDTLCNPRPVFGVLRLLNAILFAPGNGLCPASKLTGTRNGWVLTGTDGTAYRFIQSRTGKRARSRTGRSESKLYDLSGGTVRTISGERAVDTAVDGYFLIVIKNS